MIRDPKDIKRYTASERVNHWIIGISFILLSLSGLSFFHPAFFPLSQLFGGPVWARILHPFIGVLMAVAFFIIFIRFFNINRMKKRDWAWLAVAHQMVDGDDHNMPEQGKYNGGQKILFWSLAVCMLLLSVTGICIWRACFSFDITTVRISVLIHAAVAIVMICMIMVHIYAAIWVKGTIRAMWYGTVTRAWAKQHHRGWYRQITGK